MTERGHSTKTIDPGLFALVAMLQCHGIGADEAQLRHRFGNHKFGVQEMLRSAQELGLKARAYRTNWKRLAATPLPGIAVMCDGSFLLLGKIVGDDVLVQPSMETRPSLMTRLNSRQCGMVNSF